jgi:flavin-dependent dehydrogenase
VLLLEKAAHPRPKPCAGGIPACVLKIFPLKDYPAGTIPLTAYTFTTGGQKESSGEIAPGRLYSVERDSFDMALARAAVAAGAELRERCLVTGCVQEKNGVRVQTSNGEEFKGCFLVEAGGGNSVIARKLKFFNRLGGTPQGLCGYFAFVPNDATRARCQNRAHLDFNFFRCGMAGILPKGDYLWVGAYTGERSTLKELEKQTLEFIRRLGLSGQAGPFMGLPIPLYVKGASLQKGRVLLAGEAARLVNPLSGEGIKPAMKSGAIAAREIVAAMRENRLPSGYSDAIHREVGRELEAAGQFARIAYTIPSIAYRGMIRVVDEALEIMNDNLSYQSFLDRLRRHLAGGG